MNRDTGEAGPPFAALPAPSWDCHIHVFGDPACFPFDAGRRYTPEMALPEAAVAHLARLGASHAVLQHASPYGTDAGCLLWALDRLGGRAVGVLPFDEDRLARPGEIGRLHRLGVRGVRLHLAETGAAALRRARDLLDGTSWHLDLHPFGGTIEEIADAIGDGGPPVVVDHFSGLPPAPGGAPPAALRRLMDRSQVYLKLSAPYRVPGLDEATVAAYVRELVLAWPGRCLWGSDWPHTPPHPANPGERLAAQPFRPVDTAAAAYRHLGLLDAAQIQRVICDTPSRLYRPGPAE